MEIGKILFDERSGNYFQIVSDYQLLQDAYFVKQIHFDEDDFIIENNDDECILMSAYDLYRMK